MISKEHKTVFVHIPKVAGQSIETVFLDDLGLSWKSRESLLLRKKQPGEEGPDRLAHLRARDYVSLGYLDEANFDSYYKFAFVRNPYARALSFYHYLGYSRIISFDAFLPLLKKRVESGHFFFEPQFDYLHDSTGKLLVDYVGKLEHISEDIQEVFSQVGLAGTSLPHVNKSERGLKRGLAALLKTPKLWSKLQPGRLFSSKKQKELSESQKRGVAEIYPNDFESFGYEQ